MTNIFDIVNFHTAYGVQVRLREYFYDPNENAEHLRGYVPIRSHRTAFLDLAQSQLPSKENKEKVFMLTGSYGTGKSHLCLMLANYFSLKPTDLEMEAFFENWAKRDPTGSQTVRNWRGDGRYLVAICEFGEAKLFEDMLISAVEYALEKEGAQEIIFNTHFKGAIRQIEAWVKRQADGEPSGVFDDFLTFLGGDDPRQELENLKNGLRQNKSTAMQSFQGIYEKTTGHKLTLENDSLLAILKDLLSNGEFQKRYKGLVILADEFGYALDEDRVNNAVFHGFAEMSKDGVAGMQLIFIGTGHRRFEAYGANKPSQIDFRVMADRVTEVSLEAEELEQIIAALVSPKIESPVWQEDVLKKNDWLFNQMASGANKALLFDYLDEPQLRTQIVEAIYPMHPMATYCLTKMSKDLGSATRSVFAFFRRGGDNPHEGSYSWFVRNHEVTRPGGELNIYTSDILALYFKPEITTTNLSVRPEVRDYVRNYLAAVEEERRYAYKNTLSKQIDPFTQRVLDLILVYRVSGVNVTRETLEYGLNLNKPNDKKALANEIKQLLDNKILFTAPSGEYEFRRSNLADLDVLINDKKQELAAQPLDLPAQVTQLASKKIELWVEAKSHNGDYQGDKRLLRVFTTPQELGAAFKADDGSPLSFWQYQEKQRAAQTGWNERYEGIMVYVLCEDDEDIQKAQLAVKDNSCPTVIVGIPKSLLPIKETVINVLAIQRFKETEKYEKLEFQEKSLVDEMLGKEAQQTGRIGDFILARNRYLDGKGLHWYREDGKTLVADPVNEYEPADVLMNRLFTRRNTVSHEYINKAHPKSFAGSKDNPLRQAVTRLVETDKPVEIDTGAQESHGDKRYLLFALAKHGILCQDGDYNGTIAPFALENNLPKIQNKYPSLGVLIEQLKGLKRGQALNVWGALKEYTEAPYGLGPYALALFLACVVRYFGDEIRLKINPTSLGYSPTNDAEIIIDLATGKYPAAIIERRFLNPATSDLINALYNLFAETPAAAGTQQTLLEAWQMVQSWWKARTRLERAVGIYPDSSTAEAWVDFLAKNGESGTGSQVLLEELKHIYGYDPDAELDSQQTTGIVAKLKSDKGTVETLAGNIKSNLVKQLSEIFNPEGDTYLDYVKAISGWLNNLHPDQKLTNAPWQSGTSRTILEALPKLQDVEKMFLEMIPAAPGFGLQKVDDWSHDQSDHYLNLFKEALKLIENSLPKIPSPKWHTSVTPTESYQGISTVQYHSSVKLQVSVPEEGLKARVTRNEDPIHAKQFELVEANRPFEQEIAESCTYFIVSENSQGEFSKVIQIKFTNLDEGYRLISEPAPKLHPGEREYRFRNPVDKTGLVVLLRDIITHLKSDQVITANDILAAFKDALKAEFSGDPEKKSK